MNYAIVCDPGQNHQEQHHNEKQIRRRPEHISNEDLHSLTSDLYVYQSSTPDS